MANDDKNEMPPGKPSLGGWRWFFVYAVMALVIQWPLVMHLTTHISYGFENEITVPMLNLWTVWWNADRAAHGFQGYWNAPIFHPTEKTFLFSEIQPTSVVVAPIIALTGNRGLAYNVYELLILALNGFCAHRLFRRLGHVPWLAFCGGFMSQILPFVLWQFGVVQLTTLFGIYWTIHSTLDLFRTGLPCRPIDDESEEVSEQIDPRRNSSVIAHIFGPGLALGFAFGLTYWSCNYWGLFLALLLIPSCVALLNRRLFERSFWVQVLIAGCIASLMIGPIAFLQRSLSKEHNWKDYRTEEMVRDLSAHWRDHTDLPWRPLLPILESPEPLRSDVWTLGGGGLKLLLAPIGLIASLFTQRRRWGLFVMIFGALAFGLSLGPTVRIAATVPLVGGICPYEMLQKFVPGFSFIRSPFRFALFVQLSAVWLSIEALDLLNPMRWGIRTTTEEDECRYPLPSPLRFLFGLPPGTTINGLLVLPMVVSSLLISLEAIPPTMPLFELPSRKGLPVWVTWLRDNAEPQSAIACLPFPTGTGARDYEQTAIWMYWSTYHKHPLINGYSGFFPAWFNQLKQDLELFVQPAKEDDNEVYVPKFKDYAWDNPGLNRLNELPIRYVVIKRSFGTSSDVWSHSATRFRWALVASDETEQVDVYQVPAADLQEE